ncbi:MAG: LytTR family transcriptional regulator DNA-binding domain-containing protein [Mediterranea sp.]|jgi:DNA-binding LytR/AlgR family response regulator|nr:LytTR family transcriptional regulator DNA-binding domain-containing protein [Mediterranea sp.]
MEETFYIATARGFRIFRMSDIYFFSYEKEQRVWQAISIDGQLFKLRRQTGADEIIAASPAFVRINQSIIINMLHLASIEGCYVSLDAPAEYLCERDDLRVSRGYMKELKSRLFLL